MTENELRQTVVDQAKYWLEKKEADQSHRVIIDVYNSIVSLPRGYRMTYTDPWCAAFVSAVAQVCGLTDILFPECGCEQMIGLYKQAGRWEEDDAYIPRPGDVIFFDWQDSGQGDDAGASDHVGIVASVDGNTITIIEGNSDDAVRRVLYYVDSKYIRGYGLPDYAGLADGDGAGEDKPSVVDADSPPYTGGPDTEPSCDCACAVVLPVLMLGDGMDRNYELREAVWSAQILMKNRGCSVGWMGCDGEFGPKTERAVKKFQGDWGLKKTGVVNRETWTALLRG